MTTYLLRRLLFMIPTLLGITFLVFCLIALAPGGIGAALQVSGGNLQAASGAAVQQAYLEDRYGLDAPVVVQYARWLSRISPLKFGQRDQILGLMRGSSTGLPEGFTREVVSPPKAVKPPPLWRWFTPELPTPELTERLEVKPGMEREDAVRMWRRAERDFAETRFALLESTTLLKTALREYARDIGREDLVVDAKVNVGPLEKLEPRRDVPSFAGVEALGKRTVEAYRAAVISRERLKDLFDQRPFQEAGFALIPGVMSLATPDMGTAFSKQRPVIGMIADALPVTLSLNFLAIPIIYFVAIPSGMLAATRKGSLLDIGLGSLYVALYSFPVVLAGVLAIGFLASKIDGLGWFPVAGLNSYGHGQALFLPSWDSAGDFQRGWLLDRIWHMALPVSCLVYGGFAVLSKQTRAAMLENYSADYVRTAKAKGVAEKDVIFRHVFRNSLLPLITMFVTIFPAMLAGSVVVEKIFSVPGMGSLVVEAISLRDRELILANTVMIAVVNLLALLLADILYALADPRVTYN